VGIQRKYWSYSKESLMYHLKFYIVPYKFDSPLPDDLVLSWFWLG